MAETITLPFQIDNGDTSDAEKVMDNLDEIVSAYNSTVGSLSGDVVGTDDEQELSNKTLDVPIIKGSSDAAPTDAGVIEFNTTDKKLKYGDGTLTKTIGAGNRAFTWYLDGVQIVANEVGAKYIAPQGMTIKKIWFQTGSGTATLRIQKGTSDIASSMSASSTQGSKTDDFTSDSITAGDVITLDITACSSGANISVTMECEEV